MTRKQLYIWQKPWTLGVVFFAFFAVPTGFYLREVAGSLERSQGELAGLGEARAVTGVARALNLHRLYAAATLGGVKAATALSLPVRPALRGVPELHGAE